VRYDETLLSQNQDQGASNMKALFTVVVVLAGITAFAAPKGSPRIIPSDLKWAQAMGPHGPSFAFVVGNAKAKGPVAGFVKFPPGMDLGWHSYSANYEGVVLSGTMVAQSDGDAAEIQLPAGSYFGEAAKKDHRLGCSATSECVIFVRSENGLNFKRNEVKSPMPKVPPAAPAAAPAPSAPPTTPAPAATQKKPAEGMAK
jgi:quercetin dioxygenase-like cupin family protein